MKAKRHFLFVSEEKEINVAIAWIDSQRSKYLAKKYPCEVTPWSSHDGNIKGSIVWYYE